MVNGNGISTEIGGFMPQRNIEGGSGYTSHTNSYTRAQIQSDEWLQNGY